MNDTSKKPCGCSDWHETSEPGIYERTLCADHAHLGGKPYMEPTLRGQMDGSADWYEQYISAIGAVQRLNLEKKAE